jgi:hypothetical protein
VKAESDVTTIYIWKGSEQVPPDQLTMTPALPLIWVRISGSVIPPTATRSISPMIAAPLRRA